MLTLSLSPFLKFWFARLRINSSTRPFRRISGTFSAFFVALVVVLWSICLPSAAHGQSQQYTKNSPDQTMRSDARIDPATHALSLQIPLGAYAGRAGLSLPISITYSPKFRHFELINDFQPPHGALYYLYEDTNDGRSVGGWISSLTPPRIEGDAAGYDGVNGVNIGQPGGIENHIQYIARLRVVMGDGSSHELRKDDIPRLPTDPGYGSQAVFYAVDGSQLKYDSATSTLFLPDGSRYLFAASQATQYVDRNGNTLNYDNNSKLWTDTRNRTFASPLVATTVGSDNTYQLPGMNGTTLSYQFRWKLLQDAFTDPNQQLSYAGNYDCTLYTDSFPAVSPSLFGTSNPHNPICADQKYNPSVLSEIELPNGSKYRFTYNVWGEIDKVYFPTGGYERYQYDKISPLTFMKDPFAETNRAVTDRWISSDGTSGSEVHWQYGIEYTPFTSGPYITTMTAPDGTVSKSYLHAHPDPYDGSVVHSAPYGFEDARSGRAYDERVYNSSGVMLRRSLTEWTEDGPTTGGYSGATRNPRVTKQVGIQLDTGGSALATTTTMQYDTDLNVIATNHYGYAVVDPSTAQSGAISNIPIGSLLRTDETTFLVNDTNIDATTRAAYRARNLIALPTSSRVKDAAGDIVAQSSVSYDESAYPLISSGSTSGWTDPATNIRGNATTGSHWLNSANSYLQNHAQFDQFGNLCKAWDAKGNQSQIDYSSSFQYALPTTGTTAVPDAASQYGANAAFVSTTDYDATTGLVVSATDANGQTTTFDHSDPLDRIKTVTRPDGGMTTYNYNDVPGSLYVETLTKQDATRSIDTYELFDGLGRPIRSLLSVGSGNYNTIDTQYDNMGRVWRVANPYLSLGTGSAVNPSDQWSTSVYDALGRAITLTTVDSAQVTTVYGGSISGTLGTTVTVTDQAGEKRRSLTDSLSRLVRADEPDVSGNLGDVSSPNQPTSYLYDVLGNLSAVTQGAQQRFFMYDSLSRLLRARSPEQVVNTQLNLTDSISGNGQWCVGYSYDNNGNLTSKVDARNLTTSYTYDALNRNTTVVYTNDPSNTATVSRFYDGWRGGNNYTISNSKGHTWQTETAGSSGTRVTIDSYDVSGQPQQGRQEFNTTSGWSQSYTAQRSYDFAGHVMSQTYPSGRTVSYSYDQAGRTNSFSGNLGAGTSRTYSDGILYSPFGGMSKEQFGTDLPIFNKLYYNARGQLAEVRDSTSYAGPSDTTWNRGKIINDYSLQCSGVGCNATDNNGNLRRQENHVPDNEQVSTYQTYTQIYDYDSLNRLQDVTESKSVTGGALTQTWAQAYVYDRFGNRSINQSGTTQGVGVNSSQAAVVANTTTNRLYAPGETETNHPLINYDTAGNQTKDYYSGNSVAYDRVYDAENRMISSTASDTYGSQVSNYTYDGNGARVRRKVAGTESWQVYGFGGELLAEYAANASATAPQKEYGYRNGQLLVTASSTSRQNVVWTNAINVVVSGNNLTKTTGVAYGRNAGASSTQTITGGDGYFEFTVSETNKTRFIGLSNDDTDTNYGNIDFGFQIDQNINLYVCENANCRLIGAYGAGYATGDVLRTAIEGGVVKYYKNGNLVYTSTVAPTYPLMVDNSLWGTNCTLTNVVISGNLGTGDIEWLVTDQLGTPRIVFDKSGSLANTKRHDYLPFGEELFAGQNARTQTQGYSVTDGIRQKFTQYERDNETGLDYAKARYFGSMSGRFISPDPLPTSAKVAIPQSWNRYTYVLNSPLKFIDPSGMIWVYHFLGTNHDRAGFSWFGGTEKQISKQLGKDYHAVQFGKSGTATISLTDGGRATLHANSGHPDLTPAAPSSTSNQGYVNEPLVKEIGRQTEPLPKATATFAVLGVGVGTAAGLAVAAAPAAFATAENSAVFWSGGEAAKDAALEAAAANGGQTIEMTLGGRVLEATNVLTRPGSPVNRFLWRTASRYFAEGATGGASVFLRTPVNPSGTWATVEQPILQQWGANIATHVIGQ